MFLKKSTAVMLLMVAWSLGVSAKERPNIIFILADDMGYSDPGFMGSEIETPNLDRLAAAGTVCPRFMNHAKCEPSRASLMTGVHFHRQTHDHVTREFRQVTTIASELKKAGYFTLTTGKWHLPDNPSLHGFDRSFGLVSGAANHFDPDGRLKLDPQCYAHKEFALNGQPYSVTNDDFYSTDAFTDYALQFLNERPAKGPFFLYLAYTAPHWPLQAPAANIKKYENRYQDGWDQLSAERYTHLLENGLLSREWKRAERDLDVVSWDTLSEARQADAARCMAVHAAMVDRLDEQIGRVLSYLEKTDELENTLILFASDNGVSAEMRFDRTPNKPAGPVDSFRTLPLGFCNAVNTPYRKYKGSNANGGICSPFIATWPGRIPAGRVDLQLINILDIMPTLLEVAGVSYPASLQPLDRKSILPFLTGNSGADESEPMFFQLKYANSVDQKAVVQWPWKAWYNGKESWSLYRLDCDGAETTDLKNEYPEQLNQLIEAFEQFDAAAVQHQPPAKQERI
jgi:arylsulfatase